MWTTSGLGYYVEKIEPGLWDKLNRNEINWTDIAAFQESLEKIIRFV